MGVERSAIEQFLYQEAALMDRHQYDEWLALWADEGAIVYWVPCNVDDADPKRQVSVIHDNRAQLRNRITRLKETTWLSEQTPRLTRVVSNVQAELDESGATVARSNFILAEIHRHQQYLWAGTSVHTLVEAAGGLRIRHKKVLLLNNNEPLPNLMFLI